jgi:hypothetical protein
MRVNIPKPSRWIGPYQIADAVFFWQDKYSDTCPWSRKAEALGNFLAHGFANIKRTDMHGFLNQSDPPKTWFYKLLEWIDSKRVKTAKIKIDPWDTWSLDAALAQIITPALKQLKATAHGYALVDLEDVPEHLQATEQEDTSPQLDLWDHIPKLNPENLNVAELRWDWVLDEMIWAFEQVNKDWESEYLNPKSWKRVVREDNTVGWDPGPGYAEASRAMQLHRLRMENGFRLFGKYYQNLWD